MPMASKRFLIVPGALVGRQYALAFGDHGARDAFELILVHALLPAAASLNMPQSLRSSGGSSDHICRKFLRKASTPGRCLPSSHSRKAPPAVEI